MEVNMRKFLISAALLSAAAVTAPAAAQYRDYDRGSDYRGGQGVERQLDQITDRIRRAEDRDRISRSEANRLLRQAEQIDRLYDRYRRNGINQREHYDLQNRIQNLRQRLQFERREDRYDDRRDRWDR
jgi:TolA-binding protein